MTANAAAGASKQNIAGPATKQHPGSGIPRTRRNVQAAHAARHTASRPFLQVAGADQGFLAGPDDDDDYDCPQEQMEVDLGLYTGADDDENLENEEIEGVLHLGTLSPSTPAGSRATPTCPRRYGCNGRL